MNLLRYFVCASWVVFALPGFAKGTNSPAVNPPPWHAPNWKVEVVAEAPKVISPSVVCCSPDGRIFVGQDPMDMGHASDQPSDSIICIHPDGKITTFATNLYAVFGMQYIDGKLYVHHSPKFSVFVDNNGVGTNRVDLIESDNPHPWSPTFNDHIPSNCRLAMDGYLYFSTGDKGVLNAKGKDGKKINIHGGGVFRMRPDGTDLEVYSTGTRNHLDVAINSEDEVFTYDNTDDGHGWWTRVTHMVDSGFYGYPYDYKPQRPYTLWMMTDYGGGSPTGALAYNEDALPNDYQGNLFLCEWGRNQLLRLHVERDGATYKILSRDQFPNPDPKSTNKFDFLNKEGTNYFLPVGITVTPDGSGFYVTDWVYPGWKKGDKSYGRLLKVSYTGTLQSTPKPTWYVPAAMGRPFKASTKELIRGLSHPAESVRLVAQRRLAERGKDGMSRIISLLKDKKAPPYARWSALWTLDAIDQGKQGRKTILAILKDQDDSVRMQAIRQLGTRRVAEATPALIPLLKATNAAVRFRAATALGRIGDVASVRPLIENLDEKDLFARFAVFTALKRIGETNGKAWSQIVAALKSANPKIREGADFAIRETYSPELVRELAIQALDTSNALDVRTNALTALKTMHRQRPEWTGEWWNTQPTEDTRPAKTRDWDGTQEVTDSMHEAMKDKDIAVRKVAFEWVEASHDTNSAPLLREMFHRETDPQLQIAILRALGELKDPAAADLIVGILNDPRSTTDSIKEAIEAAGKINKPAVNDALLAATEKATNDNVRKLAITIFGNNKITNAAPFLGRTIANGDATFRQLALTSLQQIGGNVAIEQFKPLLDSTKPEVQRQTIRALGTLKSRDSLDRIKSFYSDTNLQEDVSFSLAQMPDVAALDIYLDGLASSNQSRRALAERAIELIRDAALAPIEAKVVDQTLPTNAVPSLKKIYGNLQKAKDGPLFRIDAKTPDIKEYESYAAKNTGDAARGNQQFHNLKGAACIRCHRMNGEGGEVGPDLTDVHSRYARAQLIESVLYPSKQILDGYQVTTFFLKNEDEVSGAVRGENNEEVTVIDASGEKHKIKKADVKNRKTSNVSLMPEGLQTGMSPAEFSDLISYLENPKSAPTEVAKKATPPVPSVPPPPPTPPSPNPNTTTNRPPKHQFSNRPAPPLPPKP